MSVIIKGMEMPENCRECYDKGTCYHIHHIANCPLCGEIENPASYVLAGAKHPDCPLGYVPPHGRLIDADALLKGEGRYLVTLQKEAICVDEICRAPTIIPAEHFITIERLLKGY